MRRNMVSFSLSRCVTRVPAIEREKREWPINFKHYLCMVEDSLSGLRFSTEMDF